MSSRRRRVLSPLVALGLLASLHWVAGAAHPVQTLRHLGSVGLAADQEAIVTVANATSATVTATVTILNASAQVLALQNLPVAPGRSALVKWAAGGPARVRATVTTPGNAAAAYPIGLFVYDAGASAPALATPVNLVIAEPAPTTGALSPYVPIIIAARNVVSVVNLGLTTATFTVSFFDGEGGLLSAQTLTIGPRRTAAAEAPPPLASGVRAQVQAPPGTPCLVSNEYVDEATGKTVAVLLGR